MANKKLKVGNVPHRGKSNTPCLRFPGFTGEWEVKKLGEIADVSKLAGYEFTKHIVYEEEGKIIALRGLNIKNNKLNLSDVKFIDNSDFSKLNRSKLYIDDLMFTYIGTIGEVALIEENDRFYLAPNVSRIRADKSKILPKFLLQYFNQPNFKNIEISKYISSSSQAALTMGNVRKFTILLPRLEEQTKISSFLSLIDERIQTQIKIIEQLKTLIKGLSEKLFSQEIRFKGFIEKWAVKKLGEIFYSEKGRGLSKDKLVSNGQYECVLYGELYTKYKEVIFDVVSKTNEEDGLKSQIGDLLIPSSTTTTGIDLANVTAINKENVLLGGDITVLRSEEKINNIFYAYYLSNYKKEEIASYAQGSTIVHLYYNHMKNMLIDLPSFEEQTAIANFLSAIDTKIQTEKNILDKYQSQKQYLLQNLFI